MSPGPRRAEGIPEDGEVLSCPGCSSSFISLCVRAFVSPGPQDGNGPKAAGAAGASFLVPFSHSLSLAS